jgi:hypothetical protein
MTLNRHTTRTLIHSTFVLIAGMYLSACLTVESKEYRIRLTSDHSGEATIRFINILSETDDSIDISQDDFKQLIEFYLEGSQLEKENPGFHNVKKRLFEQDGALVGEVSFTFDSLSAVRVFRYDEGSPYMYFTGNPLSTEQLVETNGTLGPEWMPAIFWNDGAQELYVKTRVVSESAFRRNLVRHFTEWQATQQGQKKQ